MLKKILSKLFNFQNKLESKGKRFGKGKYGRVLAFAKKPTQSEYIRTVQITGAGILLLGFLGFFIYWLWDNCLKLINDFIKWLNI